MTNHDPSNPARPGRLRRRAVILAAALGLAMTTLGPIPAEADAPTTSVTTGRFMDINACTGESDVFTVEVSATTHQHQNNFMFHAVARQGSTESGFVMDHGTVHFTINGHMAKTTLNDRWYHPETGERFTAKAVVVENLNTGEFKIDTFVTLRCLGSGETIVGSPGPVE